MKVQILIDNVNSWIVPYAQQLNKKLKALNIDSRLLHHSEDVEKGDILCLLSCEKIFKDLALNQYNLVVHESALPHGKGWSPMTWQILEGKNEIPVTLFEAHEKVDSGVIYAQKHVKFDGTELIDEIRKKQALITEELILAFIAQFPNNEGVAQAGKSHHYPQRKPDDSQLDISKSLREQINLLRVCDNTRYPAYFEYNNQKYILKIYKDE